ncbi:Sugar transport protein 8 [Castilleja foliolosa]|uniref:Sugar transport protein 8 n=1 Tax=Castilleja foliolosa TaxID=1961234 RepID=A0ABD3C9L4_9LAMI
MAISDIQQYNSNLTPYVISCWILAAFGGLMFGYDIGISGGVTSMDDFLIKFFPRVYERKMHVYEDNYCKYDDRMLQLFTSSLYLAALVASLFASKACTVLGRRPTITLASAFFILGAILCALAEHKWMLIFGRILFGVGVGFGNEAVPLFLTEIAPIQHRGGVNILFQQFVTIGIFIANLINFATSNIHPYGWRISLGLAAVPGCVLFVGSLIITETPASLVQRGKDDEGKAALKRVRGVEDVEAEFQMIVAANEQGRQVKDPFRRLFKRNAIPALFVSNIIQFFQQFTGINAIMFYAPVLFQTLGFGSDASLLSSVITGLVNVGSTFVSVFLVDKVGRRMLLLQACVQMFISQVAIGAILLVNLKPTGSLDKGLAAVVVILVCTYVMSFAWSWGPMGWLIPSEIYPIETRSAGFAVAVSSNMIFTFLIAQAFLSMLCLMKAYIFFFFAAWIVVMGLFVVFLLPETRGVPIDQIDDRLWKKHPVWKRFFKDEGKGDQIA